MADAQMREPQLIAVCGKGGVGKTSVSAALVRVLTADSNRRVLAIDADPASGLSFALGIEAKLTVDQIRNELIADLQQGLNADREEILHRMDYRLLQALRERDNLAFLSIGRPETEGCYCQVNALLKDLIKTYSAEFDVVIIDGEAGVEQVNRRVMERVTQLITVSDGSVKGLAAARNIWEVAQAAIHYQSASLILNRIHAESELDELSLPKQLPLLGWLPEEDAIRRADMAGSSFLDLPDNAFFQAVKACLERLYCR